LDAAPILARREVIHNLLSLCFWGALQSVMNNFGRRIVFIDATFALASTIIELFNIIY